MTPHEKQLLDFIETSMAANGYPPTFEEMAGHLCLRSKSGVHRLLKSLEQQRRIARIPGKTRSIELLAQSPGNPLLAFTTAALRAEIARRESWS